jgi:hypothetical protein
VSVSIPVRALICAHLATQDDSIRQRIERLLAKEAVMARADKKHAGVQAFLKALRHPIGEIIPFSANKFDIDLAYFFARSATNGCLFSQASLVSAGAAQITKTNFEYLDKWFDSTSSNTDFFINPSQREQLRSSIQAQQRPQLDVVVNNQVSFVIRLATSQDLPKNPRNPDYSLDVQLLNPDKPRSYPTPYKGVTAWYDKETRRIEIKASTPESILQLSAYASESLWLLAASDAISTCFLIPALDDPGPHDTVWAQDWNVSKLYAWSSSAMTVAIPLDLAIRCAREFHWFFVGRDLSFSRMIARKNGAK